MTFKVLQRGRAYNGSGELVKGRAASCRSRPCLCKCNVNSDSNIYIIRIYSHFKIATCLPGPVNALRCFATLFGDNFQSAIKAPRQTWSSSEWRRKHFFHSNQLIKRLRGSGFVDSFLLLMCECLGTQCVAEGLWV